MRETTTAVQPLIYGRVCRLRVKGCPSDYVGSKSGVPQEAADLAPRSKSAALGQEQTYAVQHIWSLLDHPVGAPIERRT
jgi:hypothetical protein